MKTIRRTSLISILIASVFLLSGCVRMGIDLEVNKDKTVSGTMVYAISDSLASMAGSGSSPSQGELIDAKAKGVTVEAYKQDGFTGQKYILKNVALSAFKSKVEDNSFNIKQEGNLITASGVIDMTNTTSGSNDAMSESIAKTMFASADIHISVKFPYPVTETSGELSADKKTVTWRPKLGEKTTLSATVKIPSVNYFRLIAGAVSVICFGIVGVSLVRNKKKNESENEPELNI